MKKIFILLLLLFSSAIFIVYNSNDNDIYINNDESFFSNYEIVDNKVNTYCELCIYNEFDCDKVIDNKNFGLLKESKMMGYLKGTDTSQITLKSGKNIVSVNFIGDLGYTSQRINRLLPNEIIINIVS